MILIPVPQKITEYPGEFHIDANTAILLHESCSFGDFEAALELRREIENMSGLRLTVSKMLSKYESNYIYLGIDGAETGKALDYKLKVSGGSVIVTGRDESGLFYGIQTLRQLFRNGKSRLSCLEIEDYPAFSDRGFYYDITRGKVPKLETLKELADRLSFYKLNQLQLYVEHSFAFRKHSELWVESDPITAEDIILLDEYCRRRNIELVPSLSTFGHLYHALVSKSFRHLNEYEEIPSEQYLLKDRMQHYTLDVSNPQSLEFVYAMLDEFLPLFSSDRFNICCDETFDLGKGRNKKLLEEAGAGKLYVYFVNNIIKHLKARGKKVMLWGDIILKHPEAAEGLPRDVTVLNWDYGEKVPEDGVRTIAAAGLEQYVCPGVQGWNRLISNMDAANKNIGSFIEHAGKYPVRGVLNTDWGDFGHINLLALSMPAAIFGAGLSWKPDNGSGPSDADISRLEYGDQSGRLTAALRELSRQAFLDWETVVLWYYTTRGMSPEVYGYKDVHLPKMLSAKADDIKRAFLRISELKIEISGLNSAVFPERRQDIREILVSAEGLALFQALLLLIKKKFLGQKDTELIFQAAELAVRLEYWFTEYKAVWRIRNRESELFRIKEIITGICGLLRD